MKPWWSAWGARSPDIASLVVLATAIGLDSLTFSWGNLFGLISSMGIFALTIVTVIRIIGRRIFGEASMTKVAFSDDPADSFIASWVLKWLG